MRYWWVNQNQTFKHEVEGGFLWSPKRNKNGGRNQFYENMTQVAPGDLVFSFRDTRIKAVGVATGPAASAEKPDFGATGDQWDNEGWFVPVEFEVIDDPVRPKDFVAELLPHFAEKYNPIQANGDGNQGVYLAEVSEGFAATILAQMNRSIEDFAVEEQVQEEIEAETAQQALQGRTDIGETQKQQLISARRGQGVFKANVRLNEKACRITGVTDPRLLIASHIKPWQSRTTPRSSMGATGYCSHPMSIACSTAA